jgi:hypothetical protein
LPQQPYALLGMLGVAKLCTFRNFNMPHALGIRALANFA